MWGFWDRHQSQKWIPVLDFLSFQLVVCLFHLIDEMNFLFISRLTVWPSFWRHLQYGYRVQPVAVNPSLCQKSERPGGWREIPSFTWLSPHKNHVYSPCHERPPVLRDQEIQWLCHACFPACKKNQNSYDDNAHEEEEEGEVMVKQLWHNSDDGEYWSLYIHIYGSVNGGAAVLLLGLALKW